MGLLLSSADVFVRAVSVSGLYLSCEALTSCCDVDQI